MRNALENDPNAAGTEALKSTMQSTRENGQKVMDGLTGILEELKGDWQILKPIKSNT